MEHNASVRHQIKAALILFALHALLHDLDKIKISLKEQRGKIVHVDLDLYQNMARITNERSEFAISILQCFID